MSDPFLLEFVGTCSICSKSVTFRAEDPWLRDHLKCMACGSIPRERALALVLEELHADWRDLTIHESSPLPRGISEKMRREARHMTRTWQNS